MNTPIWIAAAFLAFPAAAQQATLGKAGPKPSAAPAATPAPDHYETLDALASAAGGPFGSSRHAARAAVAGEMKRLASQGDGRALAWLVRHADVLPGVDRAQHVAEGFATLVREHAGGAWLRTPEFDPLAALERADLATRAAVVDALAAEVLEHEDSRAFALLSIAAALAPTQVREASQAPEAQARLDELRGRWPAGPWTARAAELAWRLEHLAPGRTAPALALRDVDGNELALEDWRGAHVLLDVWCSDDPDRAEHAAELAALLARVRVQRPELGLRVLGVGFGGEESAFRCRLEELDLPWPTSFEPEQGGPAALGWRLDGRPTTLWIDDAGVVRARGGSTAELEALLLAPSHATDAGRVEPLRVAPHDQGNDAATPPGRRESRP